MREPRDRGAMRHEHREDDMMNIKQQLAAAASCCARRRRRSPRRPSRSTAPGRRSRTRSTRSGSREYNKLHPNVQINYQSLGSGAGIRQLTQPDRLLRRDRRPDDAASRCRPRPARSCTSRPCSARSCPSTTSRASTQELKFTGPVLADIILGKITKWNDPAIAAAERRRDAARHRHHRRAPLRRLGHDLHLGRLPVEGLARVQEEGRRRRPR